MSTLLSLLRNKAQGKCQEDHSRDYITTAGAAKCKVMTVGTGISFFFLVTLQLLLSCKLNKENHLMEKIK